MPSSAARSETGRRPGYRLRRGLGAGSSGSIIAHSSSSMIGPAFLDPLFRPSRLRVSEAALPRSFQTGL
jgi:hypothetical protein